MEELVEEEVRIRWPRSRLRMELDTVEWPILVTNAFIRPIVSVHKPLVPVRGQCRWVHGVAVILRGDVAAFLSCCDTGLVLPSMSEFQLERVPAGCQRQDLGAEANSKNRYVPLHDRTDEPDCFRAHFRIAGSV